MTDINGTVVGLQGNPVDDESPADGYVLTWDGDDGYWTPRPVPQPSIGLRKEYFTTNTTWTCPAGVTSILVIACGGGSGGFFGWASPWGTGGNSGNNAVQVTSIISVTPGVTYTITIGSGGTGGIGNKISTDGGFNTIVEYVFPTSGNSTSFSNSGAILLSIKGAEASNVSTGSFINTYNNGSNGSTVSANFANGQGGIGGFAGPQGNGGNGGNGTKSTGSTPVVASNGSNAGNNTGAGGGGGGGAGYDNQYLPYTSTGGNGGFGGSGYMYLVY